MAGANFSRYLGFDVMSATDQAISGVAATITVPAEARLALLTVTTDTRYAVGTGAVATGASPMLLSGNTIPLNVRAGAVISVLQASASGTAYVTWCR